MSVDREHDRSTVAKARALQPPVAGRRAACARADGRLPGDVQPRQTVSTGYGSRRLFIPKRPLTTAGSGVEAPWVLWRPASSSKRGTRETQREARQGEHDNRE